MNPKISRAMWVSLFAPALFRLAQQKTPLGIYLARILINPTGLDRVSVQNAYCRRLKRAAERRDRYKPRKRWAGISAERRACHLRRRVLLAEASGAKVCALL